MKDAQTSLPPPPADTERREHQQQEITAWFDVALSVLAVVMVLLIVVELAAPLSAAWATRLTQIQLTIWGMFVAAFLIELHFAPSK